MSFSRRLAAGLPTVGATVLVALAIGGAPAVAATSLAVKAGHAVLTPSPDTGDQRGNPGYGGNAQEAPDTDVKPDSGTADVTTPPATAKVTPTGATPTRGGPGYTSPTTAPTTAPTTRPATPGTATPSTPAVTPTRGTPAGLSSAEATPGPVASTGGAGLSDATNGKLPVTGAPLGGTLALGGLMVAGGSAAIWYTRRRRTV